MVNPRQLRDLQLNHRADYYRIVREVATAIVARYRHLTNFSAISLHAPLYAYHHEELVEPWAKTYEEAVAKNMTIDNTPGLWEYKHAVDAMAECLWYTGAMPTHNLLIDHRPGALRAMGYSRLGELL